jgi:uncharacterized protein (TIGR03083 family)
MSTRSAPTDRWANHIAAIRADTGRMADAYATGPTDADVAACPGWDVRKLVEHMAYIHRWAAFAVRNGRGPGTGEVAIPDEDVDLCAWLRAGGEALADDLTGTDPDDDTWHVFPAPKKMWVWARRQAQETAMHRWDAETATLGASSLDPTLAAEGVLEYLELGLPRVLVREGVTPPASTLSLRCTDVEGEWAISPAGVSAGPPSPDADAGLRGSAASLLLVLMGRADRSAVDIMGDPTAADEWLSLPGW